MSYSFNYTLPRNEKNERPSHVLFADVESKLYPEDNGVTRFEAFLWTLIYKHYRRPLSSSTVRNWIGSDYSQFWELVNKYTFAKSKTYLVTHHLEVDFIPLHGMFHLNLLGWKLDKLISHGKVLIMWWVKDNKTLIVMNNGNIFDGSIEMWGKMLGLPKLTMPDYEGVDMKWREYCLRDTEIMVKMWDHMLEFMDEHDLGNFRFTKAGLAMNAFRHRFMNTKIAIHSDDNAVKLERESYKGGRFEALQIGEFSQGPYYSLDINSMYGVIERDCVLPYELRGYKEQLPYELLRRKLQVSLCIAEVHIINDLPVIPHKVDDKITYKPGDFWTVLTTPDLIYAMAKGWVKEVGRVTWYRGDKILSRFADYFLNLKDKYDREGNKPMRQFTKLYLNSLYGKFGQRGYEDRIIGECDLDEFRFYETYNADNGTRGMIAHYGGQIHETVVTETGKHTFVAIAAHITAYGRLRLWRLIEKAGIENVYHVATDSLVTNQKGYENLQDEIDDHIPGKLKLENTFETLIVKDVNDTIQGMTVKMKGIPKKAKQISDNTYEVTTWPRMITLLKMGLADDYFTRNIRKTVKRKAYYDWLGVDNPDL